MNRSLLTITYCVLSGVAFSAEPVAQVQESPTAIALTALKSGDLSKAEGQLSAIKSPAGKLFVQASLERAKGEQGSAIKTLANLIVNYPNDTEWIAKADYLSAEVYYELGMWEAAGVTARQVKSLYPETDIAKKVML